MMSRSTKLAYLLRHDETYDFPHDGWRTLDNLRENHGYTLEEIVAIMENDKKGRLELNGDRTSIRAKYGHSVDVFPDLVEAIPPDMLYHGTASKSVDCIMMEGIGKQARKHVHLSQTEIEAIEVGARHGAPVILKVDSGKMYENGIKFYKTRTNGLWLTDYVAPIYISILNKNESW